MVDLCLRQIRIKKVSVFEALADRALQLAEELLLHVTVLHNVHAVSTVADHLLL